MITFRQLCFYLLLAILLYNFTGCGAERNVQERRNLMMPKKSELPRNTHFKEPVKKKTYKIKVKRRKSKKLH
jgi:hypothetical protein